MLDREEISFMKHTEHTHIEWANEINKLDEKDKELVKKLIISLNNKNKKDK